MAKTEYGGRSHMCPGRYVRQTSDLRRPPLPPLNPTTTKAKTKTMLSSDSTVPLLLAVLPPLSISLLCFAPLRPDRSALLPLPFSLTHPSRKHPLPLRLFLVLAALATWLWLVASAFSPHEPWQTALHIRQRPPDYRAWREAERALPQNNLALPPPQGSGGRYVRFSNHLRSTGWGRAMQEMVMNAHLALHSGRIFVMYGYDGDAMPGDYNVFSWGLVHTRVPISALLGGPIAGGAFPPSTPHPPAITSNFFRTVCPHPTKINVTSTLDALSLHGASAGDLLTRFASYLAQLNDNCVELVAGTGQVFDAALFEDADRAADVWPSVLSSPILTAWQWSPLVASGVAANLDQLHLPLPSHKSFDPHSFAPIPGLLALHIPRSGDFADHCDDRTQPAAFNAALVPRTPASRAPGNAQTCFPTLVEILRRVAQIRRRTSSSDSDSTAPGKLSRVYILTNASRGWLAGLTYALRSAGFDAVASSRDLKVSWEQTFVVGGMDMLLASRAEVFVGNAWSTVTADVNMLRAAHGYTPESSQFW